MFYMLRALTAHIAQASVHMYVHMFIFHFCYFTGFYLIPVYGFSKSDKLYNI